ncbi:TetR family transcriptional regulator [Nocardia sp. alder85J]|uniref:TetR family transcriptional regulator n=1 Tax=Nocardia sp. alder85J TaxID=2862949 RepID=UPI001CD22308|nr:TetR family transcriptional regulator [Nocardia sp. alder85J]MCX4097385.1 TetR family transcriptional regulator [Nocardia sp. alder85J]
MAGRALRDHIEAAILDAAATVLADRGPAVSMAEIAAAAGVARATLYRYFPNREALLEGLLAAASSDLLARIDDAELDTVAVPEALARLTRGFLTAGGKYAALMQPGGKTDKDAELDAQLSEPVRRLLARGVDEGALRSDLPVDLLFDMYTGLLEKALYAILRRTTGLEQAGAAVLTIFLDGARPA